MLNILTWPPSSPQQSKAFHPKQQEKKQSKTISDLLPNLQQICFYCGGRAEFSGSSVKLIQIHFV